MAGLTKAQIAAKKAKMIEANSLLLETELLHPLTTGEAEPFIMDANPIWVEQNQKQVLESEHGKTWTLGLMDSTNDSYGITATEGEITSITENIIPSNIFDIVLPEELKGSIVTVNPSIDEAGTFPEVSSLLGHEENGIEVPPFHVEAFTTVNSVHDLNEEKVPVIEAYMPITPNKDTINPVQTLKGLKEGLVLDYGWMDRFIDGNGIEKTKNYLMAKAHLSLAIESLNKIL